MGYGSRVLWGDMESSCSDCCEEIPDASTPSLPGGRGHVRAGDGRDVGWRRQRSRRIGLERDDDIPVRGPGVAARHPRNGTPSARADGRGVEPHVERAPDPPARQPPVSRGTVAAARSQPARRGSASGPGHADGGSRRRPARLRRVGAEQRAGHERRAARPDPRSRAGSRHADPEHRVPDDRSRRQRPRRRLAQRLRRRVLSRSRVAGVVRSRTSSTTASTAAG